VRTKLQKNETMGKCTSLKSNTDYVTGTDKSIKTINEPLLHSLVQIESLLLEIIQLLDNCPFREQVWAKGQIHTPTWYRSQLTTPSMTTLIYVPKTLTPTLLNITGCCPLRETSSRPKFKQFVVDTNSKMNFQSYFRRLNY
jgi:hypothetical protein